MIQVFDYCCEGLCDKKNSKDVKIVKFIKEPFFIGTECHACREHWISIGDFFEEISEAEVKLYYLKYS